MITGTPSNHNPIIFPIPPPYMYKVFCLSYPSQATKILQFPLMALLRPLSALKKLLCSVFLIRTYEIPARHAYYARSLLTSFSIYPMVKSYINIFIGRYMRSIWKGALSFGLVNIPVAMYTASREKEISFVLLHKKDLSEVRYARICKTEEKEIPWEEIVKGYEYTRSGKTQP